jgi:catechol 2,3-dioxygenase-like lactoylglutathione lyase family enzyme
MENYPVPPGVGGSRQRRDGADSTDSRCAETSRKAYGSRGMARPSIVQVDTNEDRKENMIDHVILTVSDFKRSVAFYAKALKPLGITTFIDYEGKDGHPDLKGFGDGKRYFFWLKEGKPDPQAVHVGFAAKDHSEVDAFYKAALAAGGKSKESPQARLEYYPGYYATWVLDPDGHDIEVVNKS